MTSAHHSFGPVVAGLVSLLLVTNAAHADATREAAKGIFGTLPANADREGTSAARVQLGRTLYYDPRLSKNHDISCNSCHQLDRFGADGEVTSPGHKGQRGGRNSPTVYNAAIHISQFWDGRAPDVEEQAKGPVLNPIEMAMPSEALVVDTLRSIPGYEPLFAAAFPGVSNPITYDNMAAAIGAFERKLMTPSPFDAWMAGDDAALSPTAREGLDLFLAKGCVTCHNGAAIGGGMYRKLGLVEPYETEDIGREEVTGSPDDRYVYKVPSLRNVAETGPWLHDGSIDDLDDAVAKMAKHQLGLVLTDDERAAIIAFLKSLTGRVDERLVARPELPASGPGTPPPDPS